MSYFFIYSIFFIVGFLEFGIDQWEKLVSTRLKFWPTVGIGAINQYFDFFLNIFFFGMIISFWDTWHSGVHNYKSLLPYWIYMTGCIFGTSGAVFLYARNKKKRDKDRAINILANSKSTKKRKGKKKSRKTSADETEHLFDSVEANDVKDEIRAAAIEKSSDIIANKIEEALKE